MADAAASRPVLLVNASSGSGGPTAAELITAAAERGIDARGVGRDPLEKLARDAADAGAPALGVAGGDGSLGAVVAVALAHDLPFVCVPFGTRNHFARDAGLDCDDPLAALAAFDGEERRVDVGVVNDHVFVNNVSLGVYASLVHDARHQTKNRLVALVRMLPAAAGRGRRPLELSFGGDDGPVERRRALVLLVGNNDYRLANLADFGERPRLDAGHLHVYVLEAVGRARLIGLLARAAAGRLRDERQWQEWTTGSLRVDFTRSRVHAALDGEPVILHPPLEFSVRPRALRLLVSLGEEARSRDGAAAGAERR